MTYKELKCLRYLKKRFSFELVYNNKTNVKIKSLNFDGTVSYHFDSLKNAMTLLDKGSMLNNPIRLTDYLTDSIERYVYKEEKKIAKRMAYNENYNPTSDMFAIENKINNTIIKDSIKRKYEDMHRIQGTKNIDEKSEMISVSMNSIKDKIRVKLIIN